MGDCRTTTKRILRHRSVGGQSLLQLLLSLARASPYSHLLRKYLVGQKANPRLLQGQLNLQLGKLRQAGPVLAMHTPF